MSVSRKLQVGRSTLSLTLLFAACDLGPEENSERVSPPIEMPPAIEHARIGATYALRANDGVVAIAPRHYPGGDLDAQIEGASLQLETISISRGEPFDLGRGKSEAYDGQVRIDRSVAVEYFTTSDDRVEQSWELETAPHGRGDLIFRVRAEGQKYGGWDEDGHHFVDEETGIGLRYGNATWIDGRGIATAVPVVFEDGELVLSVPAKIVEESAYPAILDPVVLAEVALSASSTGPSGFNEQLPAIAYDGTSWIVVWADNRAGTSDDIYGQRYTESGTLLDPTSIPIVTAGFQQTAPAIAFNGTNHLLIWTDMRTGDADVRGMIIDTTGAPVGGELMIAGGAGNQENTDLATNGTTWFVTWEDDSGGTDSVRYGRVDAGGNVLDGVSGIAVSSTPGVPQRIPAISGDGAGGALIAWSHGATNEDVLAVRVNGATVVDATPLVVTASVGRNLGPDVAYDGTQYMVTWWRPLNIGANRIVAATGQVLDGNGRTVDNFNSTKSSPSIAWDDTGFMIVWNDSRNESGGAQDIIGRTVTSTGGLINGFNVTLTGGTQRLPALAAGANSFNAVVWQDTRTGRLDIQGTRVFRRGFAPVPGNLSVDSTGIVFSRAGIRQTAGEVAADTRNYLVVYANSERVGVTAGNANNILATRIRASSGAVLDPSPILISSAPDNQSAPDLAFNSTSNQFLIVWADRRNGLDFDIYGARFGGFGSTGGPLFDPNGILIAGGPGDQTFPAVAWNASVNSYLVVWQDRSNLINFDIRGARVEPTGNVTDATPIDIAVFANEQIQPDVASDGAGWAVVWTDRRCAAVNCDDIFTSYVTGAGTADANRSVASAANRQEHPRIIFNGTDFLAVWADQRNGATELDIFGAQLATGGAVIGPVDGVGLVVSPLAEHRPNLTFVPPNYFVVWRSEAGPEQTDILGWSFSPALAPIEAAPFPISTRAESEDEPAAAAFSGTNAMVIYQVFDPAPNLRSMREYARRITFP